MFDGPMAQQPPIFKTTWTPLALRVAASVVVGVLAFALAQAAASRSSGTAQVTMILEESEVSWPYHDAVRQGALGKLTSSPEADAIARDLAGNEAEIDGELLSGQSHFLFRVQSGDAQASAGAAAALSDWVIAQNLSEQRQPFLDELDALERAQADLQSNIDQFLTNGGTAADETLEAARYLENASLLAQYERQANEIQTELDLVRPQFRAASPPVEPDGLLTPLITGLAAALAALAAFFLFEPRRPS